MIRLLCLVATFFCSINTHAGDDFFTDDDNIAETQAIYYDPFEKFNKVSFKIMKFGNNLITLPLANAYDATVPRFLHNHIRGLTQNTRELINALNGLLIPHKPITPHSLSRFLFNTAFGLFGFFDIHAQYAKPMPNIGLDDISQYYTKKPLPYLVLPMGFGNIFIIADWLQTGELYGIFKENGYNVEMVALTFANVVTNIHANKDEIDDTLNNSIDPYPILRTVYYQLQQGKFQKLSPKATHEKYINLVGDEFR
jgi:ABC-type transporter lipoprotein component MlaA